MEPGLFFRKVIFESPLIVLERSRYLRLKACNISRWAAIVGTILFFCSLPTVVADEVGPVLVANNALSDEWAGWLDQRGSDFWGEAPAACDDMQMARRLYLDLIGRVPSVAEIRDYLDLPAETRRTELIRQLVFKEGRQAVDYDRAFAEHWSRVWRRIMMPASNAQVNTAEVETYLFRQFRDDAGFDVMMQALIELKEPNRDGVYFRALQSNPITYAASVSRVMLGVRLECAQCHDHPFADWKQTDFWGLAAYFSDLAPTANNESAATVGKIEHEGEKYSAKLLWDAEPSRESTRMQLASWLVSEQNPHFASAGVNRFWQQLIGRGFYPAVDDLDTASPKQRKMLDEFSKKFASAKYPTRTLIAAICKSRWYQSRVWQDAAAENAVSMMASEIASQQPADADAPVQNFVRPAKSLSPEQVFDSLEQALLLPTGRADPIASRWTGDRAQLVARLSESLGKTPEDYASGIPQALLMMNGKMTMEAMGLESSRLLRAVIESPFMSLDDRLLTLSLATLSRELNDDEKTTFKKYVQRSSSSGEQGEALGEVLWALMNSPEFVVCK